MILFRRFSKQWYWGAHERMTPPPEDEITIEKAHRKGGCDWEFKILEIEDLGEDHVLKVEMYDDAVACLKDKRIVKALQGLEGCGTLDKAEAVLKKHGILEVVAKNSPLQGKS